MLFIGTLLMAQLEEDRKTSPGDRVGQAGRESGGAGDGESQRTPRELGCGLDAALRRSLLPDGQLRVKLGA
jgi:hypothetical protein